MRRSRPKKRRSWRCKVADDLLGQIRSNGAAPRHVAIIMDGNGRWARERNLPRPFGHRAGMKAVREVVEGAIEARLAQGARSAVDRVERDTRGGQRLALNLCISYSSRAELARAARLLAEEVLKGTKRLEDIDEEALRAKLYTAPWSDPDLLIRTSGELRISNFLLWQLAYTELYMTPVLWPDVTRRDLFQAILDYQRRERRFGKITAPP